MEAEALVGQSICADRTKLQTHNRHVFHEMQMTACCSFQILAKRV